MSGSDELLMRDLASSCTLDSEVLRGRGPSIPNPTVTESLSSGKISPKRRPFGRGGAEFEVDSFGEAVGESWVMDLDVCTAFRGLLILLAKD